MDTQKVIQLLDDIEKRVETGLCVRYVTDEDFCPNVVSGEDSWYCSEHKREFEHWRDTGELPPGIQAALDRIKR